MEDKEVICKYDDKKNLIYGKNRYIEFWQEFNKNNNLIYTKHSGDYNYEEWRKYDENNNKIYCSENSNEFWFKYINNKRIEITEKEFNEIEFRKKEKEFLSRKKVTRFEIMDI